MNSGFCTVLLQGGRVHMEQFPKGGQVEWV
jgi:hypothetical protein